MKLARRNGGSGNGDDRIGSLIDGDTAGGGVRDPGTKFVPNGFLPPVLGGLKSKISSRTAETLRSNPRKFGGVKY